MLLTDQASKIEQVQAVIRDTAGRVEEERRRMQEAHEALREKERYELIKLKDDLRMSKRKEVEKEVRRMKEVLG